MKNTNLKDDVEYIIHSDSKGNIIGPIPKNEAHSEGIRVNQTHYSTWSMIYNLSSGQYGIQLKNPNKHDKYGAGKWDMGVAGHNCYIKENDSYRPIGFDENLIKEAKEEIGIDLKMHNTREDFLNEIKNNIKQPLGFIFKKFHYLTDINNEWVGLGLIITSNNKVKFEDGEVIDFKWLSPNELKKYLEVNNNYCAPLPLVFEKAEKFRKKYLK